MRKFSIVAFLLLWYVTCACTGVKAGPFYAASVLMRGFLPEGLTFPPTFFLLLACLFHFVFYFHLFCLKPHATTRHLSMPDPYSFFALCMCSLLDHFSPFLSQASFCFNETDVPSLIKTRPTILMKDWVRGGEEDLTKILCDVLVHVMLLGSTQNITSLTHW